MLFYAKIFEILYDRLMDHQEPPKQCHAITMHHVKLRVVVNPAPFFVCMSSEKGLNDMGGTWLEQNALFTAAPGNTQEML